MLVSPSEIGAMQPRERPLDPLDWGVLTETVAHEVNNILNNILLHLTVLEQAGIPVELRSQSSAIRQKGREAAAMIKSLQQEYRRQQPALEPLDLNAIVRERVAALLSRGRAGLAGQRTVSEGRGRSRPAQAPPIQLELATDLLLILGDAATLDRLLDLLLGDVDFDAFDSGRPILRTESADGCPRLCLEYPGSVQAPPLVHQFLGMSPYAGSSAEGLHYAFCKTLVRRLRGSFSAEIRADETARLVVEFQRAETGAKDCGQAG